VEFAPWATPFVKLEVVLAEAPVGGRLAADVGEDDRCWPLTPLTVAWPKGGGGRFIFWVWEAGVEIAVAIMSAPGAQPRRDP
jgi:hypothetical protein